MAEAKREEEKERRGGTVRREEVVSSRDEEGSSAMTEVSLHLFRRSRRDFAGPLESLFSSHCGIVSSSPTPVFTPFFPRDVYIPFPVPFRDRGQIGDS